MSSDEGSEEVDSGKHEGVGELTHNLFWMVAEAAKGERPAYDEAAFEKAFRTMLFYIDLTSKKGTARGLEVLKRQHDGGTFAHFGPTRDEPQA
jgi:hypothetical protein